LITLLVMLALLVVLPRLFGAVSGQTSRLEGLRWWFLVTPSEYATWNVNLLVIAVFPLAPLLVATLFERRAAVMALAVAGILAAVCAASLSSFPTPLPDWQTWSLQDIGARAMIGGSVSPSAWSVAAGPFIKAAGMVVTGAFLLAVARTVRTGVPAAGWIVLGAAASYFVVVNALWFYNDRYYLPFIPAIAYVAATSPIPARGRWAAAALIGVWAFVALTGTRDMIGTNAVVSALVADLEAQGVRPSDIDGGYASNGWRLYAHPENLPPDADRHEDVPFVTSSRETLFRIVKSPVAGYDVVKVAALPAAWWQATDRLYLVKKR
jgi:hypothetical protein